MHRQRLFIVIAAAIGAISVFLPWRTVSVGFFGASMSEGMNGFNGAGVVAFFCFLVAGILSFAGDQTSHLPKKSWVGVLILAVVALNCAIIYLIKVKTSGYGFMELGIGYGCYLGMAAAFAIGAAAWLLKGADQNLKEGIEMVKKNLSSIKLPQQSSNESSTKSEVNKIEEIEKLARLKDAGHITELEYQQMKSKLL